MNTLKLQRSVIVTAALLIGAAVWAPAAVASPSTQDQVVSLVNKARTKAGCGAVKADSRLTSAAAGHSADTVSYTHL